ncbi:MAG: nitrous oxide reductase family maturation protein NosD [Cytophagales bacterium]|jgi:nitrous oxidase accessory protein|nr:nitrous oxide reductase family maturation protein NosD [Cytophagales bacterium]MCA6386839.1 nitrous oxide reductase family maturation protein NosD [Cytophagales bacterium]MCA6390860.1 nitrous oxide reductase family maturation protein NosD [Cytophagales bacterium]MCA6395918.1 nitrous oxide reductase family maturation protein NosD [Cytophagales bacterium]MCA6397524.1 nitrous oxide reductase family maturation protein NosD [Cytophagales bacterium]
MIRVVIFVAVFLFSVCTFARTWVVAKNSSVKSIKSAIELAAKGDTIRIMKGIYKEGNMVIQKSIVIIGIDYPVLDGENKYEIFTIAATDVSIIGLRMINTGVGSINDISAISAIEAKRLRVLNNQFENTFFGIHLANCIGSVVEDNVLHSNAEVEHQIGNGIHAWKCDSITIRNNKVSGHRDGIYFEFVTNSLVEKNFSHHNMRYGLHFMFSHNDEYRSNVFQNNGAGVAVMYTKKVKMISNRFEDNWGASSYGLLLKDIGDADIQLNHFAKNTVAVYMEGSSRCHFTQNVFSGNGWAVKMQANCDENVYSKNSFLSNTFDMATNGSLVLNTVDANYWDKYEGYDLDKDRVGDVPYHPVSLYSMVVEKMPSAVMLWRSFLVYMLDRTEKVLPSATPENLKDIHPAMRNYDYNF